MIQRSELVSAQEVKVKQFPTVRFGREGVSADAVKSFLNQVEKTIKNYEAERAEASSDAETKQKELDDSHRRIAELEEKLANSTQESAPSDTDAETKLKEAHEKIASLEDSNKELTRQLESTSENSSENASQVLSLAERTADEMLESVEKEASDLREQAYAEYEEQKKSFEEEKDYYVRANKWLSELESDNKKKLKRFYEKNIEELEKEYTKPIPFEYIVGTDDILDDEIKNNAGDDSLFDEPAWHDDDEDDKKRSKAVSRGSDDRVAGLPSKLPKQPPMRQESAITDTEPKAEAEPVSEDEEISPEKNSPPPPPSGYPSFFDSEQD